MNLLPINVALKKECKAVYVHRYINILYNEDFRFEAFIQTFTMVEHIEHSKMKLLSEQEPSLSF